MSFVEFLQSLRRRWLYVVVAVVLGGAIGVAAILTATPQYKASATVYFSVPVATSANDLAQGGNYAQQQLMSYAELATKPIVIDPVIDQLDLNETAQELAGSVSAVASNDTVLITISASDPSARTAAAIANAVADQLGTTVTKLSPKSADNTPTVDYAIAGRAVPPPYTSSPKKKIDLGAGLLAGLIIGVLAALGRDRIDNRIWDESDIGALTALGTIPFDKSAEKTRSPLIADWLEGTPRTEAFRQLRTALQFVDVDHPMRLITVTSSTAAEGKTGVSSNLAVVFAEAGHRVLLIDADLRRPAVAHYFGIDGSVGLTNVLAGQVQVDEAIHAWGHRQMSVLPSGSTPPNPSELLGSERMVRLLADLKEQYDVIIVDTPPLLPVTDAALMAANSDGVLLLARHGKTRRNELERTAQALIGVDAKIIGVVLNRVPRRSRQEEGNYGATGAAATVSERAASKDAKHVAEIDTVTEVDVTASEPSLGHPHQDHLAREEAELHRDAVDANQGEWAVSNAS